MLSRVPVPWTNLYGLARTLIAGGMAGTLLFSGTDTLFRPVVGTGDHPVCQGVSAAGAFCLVPREQLGWVQWAAVAVLLVVACGWRPRFTGLPHAYVAFSVYTGIAIGDGGDQIASVLALLLVLPTLGDRRRWHWQPPVEGDAERTGWVLAGAGALVMVRLQMSFLYFQAAVAKLPHTEWADGSAMYYWGHSLNFGAPGWLQPLVHPLVSSPLGTALLTWVPLAIEITLAVALLLPQRVRWGLLAAGLGFHASIAVLMGLWSFALAMWGGVLLLCAPLGARLYRRQVGPVEPVEEGGGDTAGARHSRTSSSVSSSDIPDSRASATR